MHLKYMFQSVNPLPKYLTKVTNHDIDLMFKKVYKFD